MRQLLLISSSRVHGSGFLEHCDSAIQAHLSEVKELLFIPYALADHDQYTALVRQRMEELGISVSSIHESSNSIQAVKSAESIFIGGGNSFRLLKRLYDEDLIGPLRNAVSEGKPYMGSSAGTNMACPTIRTTNDMPIVEPPSFQALGLIPFQINPHFLDADPNSIHKGETREQRLTEYLEENDGPVAGIREGSWLRVVENGCTLLGSAGMMLFEKGKPPTSIAPNTDLSHLLNPN